MSCTKQSKIPLPLNFNNRLLYNWGLLMRAMKFTWKHFLPHLLFSSRVKFAKSISAILISLVFVNVSSGSSIIPWPDSVSCVTKGKPHSEGKNNVHYRRTGCSTTDTREDLLCIIKPNAHRTRWPDWSRGCTASESASYLNGAVAGYWAAAKCRMLEHPL